MDEVAGQMLAGQVRSVIGGATVEQIIGHRDRVTQEIKKRSRAELETLGIVVDVLEILAASHAAGVARQARMAQANADLEASEREREVAELR
jgi:flotillin